jgi:hypothetical protein
MNKWIGVSLVLITLCALGMAVQARVQLRRARAVVAEDLSGNSSPDATMAAGVASTSIPPAAVEGVLALQQQVAALQAERDKLKSDLAAAQSALVSRAQNAAKTAPAR